jgi:hypothetical protein
MIDFSNFEKINDESYVWRNFINEDLTNDLFNESLAASNGFEGKEYAFGGYAKEVREDKVQLLHGEVDQRLVDKVNDFFKDTEFEIKYFLHWHSPANIWFPVHRDEEAPDPTPLKKAWGGVVYLSEMDGGELFYPTNNTWFQPHKGDLVLHTASIIHGTTGVKGDNKRFITFVVYDKTQPVDPNDHPTREEESAKTMKDVMESKEWLATDLGKRFLEYQEWYWGQKINL